MSIKYLTIYVLLWHFKLRRTNKATQCWHQLQNFLKICPSRIVRKNAFSLISQRFIVFFQNSTPILTFHRFLIIMKKWQHLPVLSCFHLFPGVPDAGNNLRKSHFIMCHVTFVVFQQPWPGFSDRHFDRGEGPGYEVGRNEQNQPPFCFQRLIFLEQVHYLSYIDMNVQRTLQNLSRLR